MAICHSNATSTLIAIQCTTHAFLLSQFISSHFVLFVHLVSHSDATHRLASCRNDRQRMAKPKEEEWQITIQFILLIHFKFNRQDTRSMHPRHIY